MRFLKKLFSPSKPESTDLIMFQKRIGYRFRDCRLLEQSLTHSSLLYEASVAKKSKDQPELPLQHNQRLEFLGDAVLSLILAQTLYQYFPDQKEGVLAQYRSALAQGCVLATIARELKLDVAIRLGPYEDQCGGRKRDAVLEDALEALIAAIYLDSDLKKTTRCVLSWYGPLTKRLRSIMEAYNPKGQLQEVLHDIDKSLNPIYHLSSIEGPAHRRKFRVEVRAKKHLIGTGEGLSKKKAQEAAALAALQRVQEEPAVLKDQ